MLEHRRTKMGRGSPVRAMEDGSPVQVMEDGSQMQAMAGGDPTKVIVTFAGAETQVMGLQNFTQLIEHGQQQPQNGNSGFFSCYILRKDTEENMSIPRGIVRAMHAQSLLGDSSINEISSQLLQTSGDSDSANGDGSQTIWGGDISSSLTDLGSNVLGAIKSSFKMITSIYHVAEVIGGALGPSGTRQKVEQCLTEIDCILIVLSLVIGAIGAANWHKKYKKVLSADESSADLWHALYWYTGILFSILVYSAVMVWYANKMAADETTPEKRAASG